MSSFTVVLMFLAVAVSLDGVYALSKCYQCTRSTSGTDKTCGDPFSATNTSSVTCNTNYCSKIVTTTAAGGTTVYRGCEISYTKTGCQKCEMFGDTSTYCICTGDLCNTASRDTFGGIVLMSTTGGAVIAVLFSSYLK